MQVVILTKDLGPEVAEAAAAAGGDAAGAAAAAAVGVGDSAPQARPGGVAVTALYAEEAHIKTGQGPQCFCQDHHQRTSGAPSNCCAVLRS